MRCGKRLQGMALRCLSTNLHARPAADEIEGQLGGMVAALAADTMPQPAPFSILADSTPGRS